MKKLMSILGGMLVATAAQAVDAYLDLASLNCNPATNRIVEHQRLQPFPGNTVSNWSGSGGFVVISNVGVGDYNVWVKQRGQAGPIAFSFSITTNDSGTVFVHTNNLSVVNVGTYPKTGQAAWSIAASESRYAPKGAGVAVAAGDNVTATTNGTVVTISADPGGVSVTGAQLVTPSTNAGVVTLTVETNAIQQLTVAGATNAAAVNGSVTASNFTATGNLNINVNGGTITAGANTMNSSGFATAGGVLSPAGFTGNGAGLTNVPGVATGATNAAGLTLATTADALTAAQNATNKFKADIGSGDVPVAASSLTGSGALPPDVFPATPPNNYAKTNAPSFINGVSFKMPPSYGVSIPFVIGTNYGPGLNIYDNYVAMYGWASGFKWLSQSGNLNLAILDDVGRFTPKKVVISDQSSGFKGPATETKDTLYTDFIGRQMPVPVLGWNSFYEAPGVGGAPAVSAALITNAVQRRIANGMRDAGFNVIAVDDSWMQTNRINNRIVANSNNFPNGIQPVVDYCHANGFKFEIYLAVGGETTCGGTAGTPFRYLEQDITDCISWGVDGFKLDKCNITTDGFSDEQWFRKVATLSDWAIHNVHEASGYNWTNGLKHIYTLVTSDSFYDAFSPDYSRIARPSWTGLGGVNIWQTGNASIIGVASVSNLLIRLEKAQNSIWFRGIGHYEELLPFSTGTNNFSYPVSTSNECRTAMTANAIGPSPTYPCDGTTNIFAFTNLTVNRIIQDPGCVPGVFIYSNDYVRALTRPLYVLRGTNSALGESTENAVAIFNPNATSRTLTLSVGMMNLKSNVAYMVYDCWSNSVAATFSNAFSWTIIGDRADLLKIMPATNYVYASGLGDLVTTPIGNLGSSYNTSVFYEKDDFMRCRFLPNASQNLVGDLGWYYWTIGGGALVNPYPASQYPTNWPRAGIQALGNTSTTSGQGFQFSPNSQYEANYQPLVHADYFTNWQARFVVRLINTNGVNYRIGVVGGSTYAVLADPEIGAYFRFNTNSNNSAKWQFITKGASTTTNNMGVADATYFHTFRIFNDTGVTNVVRAQIDSGTIVSVTNSLNQYGLGPQIYGHTLGGTGSAPQLWIDYYDLYISGIAR